MYKRGHFKQDIGRSKGGLTTKIQAVVDALGNPLRILVTAGNIHEIVPATNLIEGIWGEKLPADRAYDANKLIALAKNSIWKWVFLLNPDVWGNAIITAIPIKKNIS